MEWPSERLWLPAATLLSIALFALADSLWAADEPIGVITRGGPDLVLPSSSTDNLPVGYGLGFPVQLGPQTAGLLCNLRVIGVGRTDYEDGTDLFVFDDVNKLAAGGPTPISRNEKERDATTGEARFIAKYPAVGGFWPLGAKLPDGSPHPGAGKGFAICQALSFVGTGEKLTWTMFSQPTLRCYTEVMQLAFDGHRVTVTHRELIRTGAGWPTGNGWGVVMAGMQSAIPDGPDLLIAASAQKDGVNMTGVCRLKFTDGQWLPSIFTPVAPGAEASLVRRRDQSLLFLTRPHTALGPLAPRSIMLWTSADAGQTWQQLLQEPNRRPQTPVCVNVTPDGKAFILANTLGMTNPDRTVQWWHLDRAQLVMWQVADSAAELKPAQVIRDAWQDFGPPPPETMWDVDHATSAVVRLADGQWHGLLTYRVIAFSVRGDAAGETVTPHTGCYVEQMPAVAAVSPPWRF